MRLALVAFGLVLLASGCAANEEDYGLGANAVEASDPLYDGVVSSGVTSVTTDATPTGDTTSSTRLVGYIAAAHGDALLDKLLSVGRWTEIEDREGERPFKRAQVLSDTREGNVRTVKAKVKFDGGATLDVQAVTRSEGNRLVATVTNTSECRHWLLGLIIKPGNLNISVTFVPHAQGTIVDATMRAKLEKLESRGAELTTSIESIFGWLKAR